MKIRNGFVSNSSSSSFLLYGIYIDREELYKQMDIEQDDDGYTTYMKVEKKISELGLVDWCPYDDGHYVGISWDEVGDDETGLQFKARVVEKLKTLLPKAENIVADTHEYAWHDG